MEETGGPRENHWPVASHWQTLSHYVVSSTPHFSMIGTHNVSGDRYWSHKSSYKSNYHTSIFYYESVLLVGETGVLGENHRPVSSHWQTSSHKVVSSTPRYEWGSNSQL